MSEQQGGKSHNEILDKIKSGKVTMHSKTFLAWRTVLWVLALLLLAAAGIFLISFIIFALRASGVWDLPNFGLHGLQEFLAFFPWLFVPAVLLFIWLLERFVLRHSFAYRLPVLYSALGLIAIIVAGSAAVATTSFHSRLYQFTRQQHLPIAGDVYDFFGGAHPDDFHIGSVLSVVNTTYSLQTREGTLDCITNQDTHFYNNEPIMVGDFVEVIGPEKNSTITAQAMRKLDPQNPYPMRPHGTSRK